MGEGPQEGLVERAHVSDLLQICFGPLNELIESLFFEDRLHRAALKLELSLHSARILLLIDPLASDVVCHDACQSVEQIFCHEILGSNLLETEADQAE